MMMEVDQDQRHLLDLDNSEETQEWLKLYKDEGDMIFSLAATYTGFTEFEENYCTQYGSTPLHHAIKTSNITILRKMLLKGANVYKLDSLSITPLYYAILIGNDEIMQVLLDHGAKATDNFVENGCEFSYFQRVIERSNKSTVKLFIKNGCDVNQIFTTDHFRCPKFSRPLHIAVLNKRLETIELLLNYNANVNDVNDRGDTPLHIACAEKFLEAVDLLLRNNALVNIYSKDNLTPLCEAIKKNNNRIVELLLSYGAFVENDIPAVDICTFKVIQIIISAGNINMLIDLLSHGLNVNMFHDSSKVNGTFLHAAVETDQIEIVNLLLKYNIEVNIQDNFGRTPLHIAAIKENEEMIQLLLQSDVNLQFSPENSTLNCMDKYGYTPLYLACTRRNIDCVQYLLECGADVNAESHKSVRPLHLACEVGSYNIVELLVHHDATVNVVTDDKLTPLHIAVNNNHKQIVELLLINDAVTVPLEYSITPLEIAVLQSNLSIIELLLQYNADVNNVLYRKAFFSCLCDQRVNGCQIVDIFFKYGFLLTPQECQSCEVLLNAVKNGYLNLVQYLLFKGVNAGAIINGKSLLHYAAENNHVEIIQLLLLNGADIYAKDTEEEMPIVYSISNNDDKSTELFLKSGFNVREHPDLLLYAVRACNKSCRKIVELLVEYGANINYLNYEGNVLHVLILSMPVDCLYCPDYTEACSHCPEYVEAFTVLIKKGVNVNATGLHERTPLQMAIYANLEKQLIELLLKNGADPNFKEVNTEAPLHIALHRKSSHVKVLLNYGADINEKNVDGNTPIDVIYHNVKKFIDFRQRLGENGSLVLIFKISQIKNEYCLDCFEILVKHVMKLKLANLYLNENNMKYIYGKSHNSEEIKFQREILKLQSYKISNISAFDLLTKPKNVITRYLKHENMLKLRELLIVSRYPNYGNMILVRLEDAYRRQSFANKTKQFLYHVNGLGLPDACTQNIIDYLSTDDLRNICYAFAPSALPEEM